MIPTSEQRARAAAIATEIADQLAAPPPVSDPDYGPASTIWHAQALSKGAAGVAVLHGIRARDGVGDPARILPWVQAATRSAPLSTAKGSGLWFGAAAVAFALRSALPGYYRSTLARLDGAIDTDIRLRLDAAESRLAHREPASADEFDLVRGLTGMGGYLLNRDPNDPLLARVLTYLTCLTRPQHGRHVPGWWTYEPPAEPDAAYDGGFANLGAAHGITGPLSLLALSMRQGITVPGQAEAIDTISQWLRQCSQPGPTGPWWPEHITSPDLHRGVTSQRAPRRPSWCYGTPGITRALQLAGIAVGDPAGQQAAEDALTQCLADPGQLALVVDPALCHGWAGIVLTALAATDDARTPRLAQTLAPVIDQLLDHAHDPGDHLPGLIHGRAGVALTLHQLNHPHNSSWQTCLLVNSPNG